MTKRLALALSLVQKQIESFCNMLYRKTGINHYWVIKNCQPIIDHIEKVNFSRSARNITTFDFTTLYTFLDHVDILTSMNEVIDLAFKKAYRSTPFISVYNTCASWSTNPHDKTFTFNVDSLKSSLKFVLENAYFSVGNSNFKQTIGIPIGVDCAPPIANLTLFRYEYNYISSLYRSDYKRAYKLRGCFRLMDDITSINDDGVFQSDIPLIYPSSLTLKKENTGCLIADVLDLTIECHTPTKTFSYCLYDKRDKFNFNIVNFPHLSGNISCSCAYGVFTSQVLTYRRLCSSVAEFKVRLDHLTSKLCSQGYSRGRLSVMLDQLSKSIQYK